MTEEHQSNPESNSGLILPVHRHSHPGDGITTEMGDLVARHLTERNLVCGQGYQHEHGSGERHHHHTLDCLVDAGKISNTEAMLGPIGEAAKLRFDLEMMTTLNAQREREAQILEPLVDMVGLWKDHRYKVTDVAPEVVITEFTDMVGRNLRRIGGGQLYEEWKRVQARKFGFDTESEELAEARRSEAETARSPRQEDLY